jgi:hypothetical protein
MVAEKYSSANSNLVEADEEFQISSPLVELELQ